MTSPRVEGAFDTSADEPVLRIVWDRGTGDAQALPASYFDAPEVDSSELQVRTVLKGVVDHPTDRELDVHFGPLKDFLANNSQLSFFLAFPDRRGFIECGHPGTDDSYYLNVTLTFSSGALANSELHESIARGGI
jgi:hypothetical protein